MAVLSEDLIHSLEDVATRLRIHSVRATTAAGSGHPTSCASAADLVAALFFDAMRFDPDHPRAVTSDRFVLSKGHAAPLLYAAWAEGGALKPEDLLTLRRIDSDLEGHPTPRLPFVDVATGSLGQGLGVGAGLAIGARMAGADARAWVLLGDGEVAEGSVWEAAALAGYRRLDNLVAIVDVNGLGQSGETMLGHEVGVYQKRFAAFGWRAIVVDGHDMRAVVAALRRARSGRGAPTAVVARTVKGKGLEVEGAAGWHGKPLPADAADRVVAALEQRLHHVPPPPIRRARGRGVAPVAPGDSRSELDPALAQEIATREAYGRALTALGAADPRIVALDGDVKNSTHAELFATAFPDRFVECFIAEQSMASVAAGLAAQRFVPFASSFACFLTRAADQIRIAGISRNNTKFCGSHSGVSIGEDGPSQMALEDLALFRAVPDCAVLYPADGVATDACVRLAVAHDGPAFLRTTRMKTPPIYRPGETFRVGGLKVVRESGADRLTVVGAGVTLHEALAAYDELAQRGIAVRVIDLYSVKPVDREALLAAARATGGALLTVEDHYREGGIGSAVLEAVGADGVRVERLAVAEVPRSGRPRELLHRYGIDRAAIVAAVVRMLA